MPADLVNDYLQDQFRLRLVRDYQLPLDTTHEDLVICASFSGNTEETLATLQDAKEHRCAIVIMCNGGKLQEIVQQESLASIPIPDCIQPRSATGHFFASTLALLYRLDLLDSRKSALEDLENYLTPRQAEYESKGKALAKHLVDKIPIIYGPPSLTGACRIWKIKFNENAKIQSFYNVFPELNHNEMVGFTRLVMKPALIYLQSQFMHPRISKRMEVMKELLGGKMPVHEVKLNGENLLQETFESLAIGDYTSYHLAQAYGIDPAPVEMVEDFKLRLK